jgi:cytochrome c peroxidase
LTRVRNILLVLLAAGVAIPAGLSANDRRAALRTALKNAGFTGRVESTLPTRLGRPINPALADLGRLLFFDKVINLRDDNSCAGCHSPTNGMGDSQPMAIGVQNNGMVGPNRKGPRNQRRSPAVINTVFYPALMWTPRFLALSGNPFNSPQGFKFPPPENVVTGEPFLLVAHASLPATELVEAAGFHGIASNPGPFTPRHYPFDDGLGEILPTPDASGFHNFPIQDLVQQRLNAIPEYLVKFGQVFNNGSPLPPGGITLGMRRRAIAEFQASITAANAPIDRFARGELDGLSGPEERGGLLFFGKGKCVSCHAVGGNSNEMFSDFKAHRIGGPQLFPVFGVGTGNVIFDGPGENEDFGFEQSEGNSALRYMFRTAPLRNLKVARAFFHNGAFGTIGAAIAHHLDVLNSLRNYNPALNNVPTDLRVGPSQGIIAAGIDPLLRTPIALTAEERDDLTRFVSDSLFDPRVLNLCRLIPTSVPSGMPLQRFEGCP